MPDMPEKLLSVTQVAQMFQVHITTVRRWRRKGLLEGVKKGKGGRLLRFRESDVLELLKARNK